MANSAAQLEIP